MSLRSGLISGLNGELTAGGFSPSGPIPGVTRDAANLNYYPATAAEWTTFLAAIGVPAGNPICVWNLQEASGNPVDAVSGFNLTSTMTLYQQAVTGATRKGIKGVDGTGSSRLITVATPNPATTSLLFLAYIDFSVAPSGIRGIIGTQANSEIQYNSTGKLRYIAGATANGASNVVGPRWIAMRTNLTASTDTVFTDQEKIVGTFATPVSGAAAWLGGQTIAVGASVFSYGALFSLAAAERSDAEVRLMFQGLGATGIPW